MKHIYKKTSKYIHTHKQKEGLKQATQYTQELGCCQQEENRHFQESQLSYKLLAGFSIFFVRRNRIYFFYKRYKL